MRGLILFASLLLLSGCLQDGLDVTPVQDGTEVNFYDSDNFNNYSSDEFKIVGITPENQKLFITVSYPGGCALHTFDVVLIRETSDEDSQISIFVYHNNGGETCEALIPQTLSIDLNDFIESNQKPVITVVNAFSKREIIIDPVLANIRQSNDCILDVNVANSICGQGIWQNNWLKMYDSLGFEHPVWLQPVKLASGISSSIPKEGSYKVGVSLLFGYEIGTDASCLTIPEGPVVPVVVNCISRIN